MVKFQAQNYMIGNKFGRPTKHKGKNSYDVIFIILTGPNYEEKSFGTHISGDIFIR